MKFTTKQVTTGVISVAIMLMCFAIFVLWYNDSKIERVTYIVDDINSCQWEQYVVTATTEAYDDELTTVEVDADVEQIFLTNAATNGECVAKLGDVSGSYASQLNAQYENQ